LAGAEKWGGDGTRDSQSGGGTKPTLKKTHTGRDRPARPEKIGDRGGEKTSKRWGGGSEKQGLHGRAARLDLEETGKRGGRRGGGERGGVKKKGTTEGAWAQGSAFGELDEILGGGGGVGGQEVDSGGTGGVPNGNKRKKKALFNVVGVHQRMNGGGGSRAVRKRGAKPDIGKGGGVNGTVVGWTKKGREPKG